MRKFTVEYFEKEDGSYPAEDFILSLDVKMKAKIFRSLELLEMKGNSLREPYSKHLEDGIFELRVKQGSDSSRILYFFVVNNRVILTNGFIKKTQKTPRSEMLNSIGKIIRRDVINMAKNFRETLNQELQDPDFKKEWDNLEVEFQIIKAMLDGRDEQQMTQKELSEMTGISQGDISKIENGNANPSIRTLSRLASGMGKHVKITFENNL